jgi:succinate dehydrogenase / fumarate reductase flavoprotein subunit
VARLDGQTGGEDVASVRDEIQRTMQAHCGVFRFPDLLRQGVDRIRALGGRVARTQVGDKSRIFNTARIDALELDNLYEAARATMVGAEAARDAAPRPRGLPLQRRPELAPSG